MKLAIISHTEHYKNQKGEIVGWGPTVTELNHLAKDFDKLYHVAFFYTTEAPKSSLPYTAENISFIALTPSGGKSIFSKLNILCYMPAYLYTIAKILRKVDVFQFRAPIGFGVFLIPWLSIFYSKKKGWYKYAGNWKQQHAPLGYILQRKLLRMQSKKVTVNGKWPGEKMNIIPFENPCLTQEEREESLKVINTKNYVVPVNLCFVGRLEDEKGVQRIIDALKGTPELYEKIKTLHFIGEGAKMNSYEQQITNEMPEVIFHGFLERKQVFEIYKVSNFILLPSNASEGFPKVIAEAMNYGCIPIVSTVSSIGQYITEKNGYLFPDLAPKTISATILEATNAPPEILKKKAIAGNKTAKHFTFDYYRQRITNEIL